jgi:hypothetical protein
LAVLVVTYLEDGREAAARMARAFPQGQFSTLAYLLLFQLAGPSIGLGGRICLSYAAAVFTLFAVEGVCRRALPVPAILTDRGEGSVGRSFPDECPLGPRQRLQELSLPTRRKGSNDCPLKNAAGSRVIVA